MASANEFRHILRLRRTEKGLSQDALGSQVHVTGSQIGHYETGRSLPPDDVVVNLDRVLGTGTELRESAERARDEAVAPWMRPWKLNESRAVQLRWFEHSLIPGLLQTEAYAREIIAAGTHTEVQVAEMTRERMERQAAALERVDPYPVPLTAIIGEAALRIGPPALMKDQLEHLVDIGHRQTVHVRVLPFSAGLHPGLAGSFVLATLPDSATAAYIDDQLAGRVCETADKLRHLVLAWEMICGRALPCDQSRDLILRVIDEHERASVAHVHP